MRHGLNELRLKLVRGHGTRIPLSCSPLYFLTLTTYSQLGPSRSLGQYFSIAFFLESFIGHSYILTIELPELSSDWSMLRSCNPHLMWLVSSPTEIHLVLGIPNP